MPIGLIHPGEPQALTKRFLSEETCRHWGYTVGELDGESVQIANYGGLHDTIAQKVRKYPKDFLFLGDAKAAGLYGQHLWRDGGKMVVVTEGELDALSVSQLQSNKWPVVSVPNGAAGATKSIKANMEWLEKFETVVFMFDQDEPGIKAAKECANVLTPGKAKIASLPLKDPNEMLVAGRGAEVINAIWSAKTFRPDGIVAGTDLWEVISTEPESVSIPYPWSGMNDALIGVKRGQLVTFCAGTGIGKSTACREIAHHLIKLGETVGIIALEENIRRTSFGLMSIELNKRLHLTREGVSDEALRQAFDATVGSGHCYLYSHFGSTDSANLVSRIRYLSRGCGCNWIVLDHLSIVVSGNADGDERRSIDQLMTNLRTLVEETGIGLMVVSHLKRLEGAGHEDGAQVRLNHLRGSGAIAQLSDTVIALERDQQSEAEKNVTVVRVLKDRDSNNTGVACTLEYNSETGRLIEVTEFKGGKLNGTPDF